MKKSSDSIAQQIAALVPLGERHKSLRLLARLRNDILASVEVTNSTVLIEGYGNFPNITWGDIQEQAKELRAQNTRLEKQRDELVDALGCLLAVLDVAWSEDERRNVPEYREAKALVDWFS